MNIQAQGKTRGDASGNSTKAMPDREALEIGFLILSLQPDQPMCANTVGDSAEGISALRTHVLRGTSYEKWASKLGQGHGWGEFWRAYASLEAPGAHIGEHGPRIPQYPLAEHYDVNRCDLSRLAESIWHGVHELGRGAG